MWRRGRLAVAVLVAACTSPMAVDAGARAERDALSLLGNEAQDEFAECTVYQLPDGRMYEVCRMPPLPECVVEDDGPRLVVGKDETCKEPDH